MEVIEAAERRELSNLLNSRIMEAVATGHQVHEKMGSHLADRRDE